MNHETVVTLLSCGLAACAGLWLSGTTMAESGHGTSPISQQAEQSFQQLQQAERESHATQQAGPSATVAEHAQYPTEQYLVGKGRGDLNKGQMICQRVSELSARTDLAKQIRVMVKEHLVDRIRERTGREAEQDIELIREEIVQEYLQGVKIVDHRIDEEKKICSATAIMPKSLIQPKPPSN
ncbi:MAG: hypothetical protein OEV08_00375 [Nitrospira sp.]|nr:hypothetical protein [Nitrospira sp.]